MFFKADNFFLYNFIGLSSVLVGYNPLITYNKKYFMPDKENEFNWEENITQVLPCISPQRL